MEDGGGEKQQNPTEIKMDPVINQGTYRLNINSAGLFRCNKTELKFLVKCPMTIDYTMAEIWNNRIPNKDRRKYETKSPLYEIKTSAGPPDICGVYIPHFVKTKDIRINKAYLQCAYFQDGKFNHVLPSNVESSHVFLKNVTFSAVGVLIEISQTSQRQRARFSGTVLMYCKPVTQNFLLHVYLVPMNKEKVKEAIKEKETRFGFRCIDKPPYVSYVCEHTSYNINTTGGTIIGSKDLYYLHSASEHYPYAEVRVPETFTSVQLNITETGEADPIWTCVLEQEDLSGRPPSTSSSSSSDSGRAKEFLLNNHEQLCTRLGYAPPLLVSMVHKSIITEHEEEFIKSHPIRMEQSIALLKMVTCKGAEEEFYKILKENDPCLVQSLEQANMNTS